jgi:hypothetical protein
MENYQRALSRSILEKLDPSKLSLLEISWGIVGKTSSTLPKSTKEGLPLVDPGLASQFVIPIVVAITGKIVGELLWKAIEKRKQRQSGDDLVSLILSRKGSLKSMVVEMSLERGIKKRDASKIVDKIFLKMEDQGIPIVPQHRHSEEGSTSDAF